MAPDVSAKQHENYLQIVLAGNWDNSSFSTTADKILFFCEEFQATRVLMDVRDLAGNPNALERFAMATVFTGKYFKARLSHRIPPCRFAVIGHHPLVDRQRFEETVAVNRGLPVKTFTNLEQALEWLEVQKVTR